jgi:hypothetical protein
MQNFYLNISKYFKLAQFYKIDSFSRLVQKCLKFVFLNEKADST